MKGIIKKIVLMVANRMATVSANSSCALWFYQPKETKTIEKLRKF